MKLDSQTSRKIKHKIMPTEENNFHPRMFHAEILALVVITLFAFQTLIYSGAIKTILSSLTSISNFASVLPAMLAEETNQYRDSQHVADLVESPLLSQAATLKAQDMAKRGYFSHIDPDGQKPWKWISEVGYKFTYAGENLAIDFTDSQDVTNAWIASFTHRENLVNPNFKEFGIGVADGVFENKPTTFVVQFFASPTESEPVSRPITQLATKATSTGITKTVAKSIASTSATATSLASIVTATSSGEVLGASTGVSTEIHASTTPVTTFISLADAGSSAKVIGAIVYSPKKISFGIAELLSILLLGLLLVTFVYSIIEHQSASLWTKVKRGLYSHKKIFAYSFVFIFCLVFGSVVLSSLFTDNVQVASAFVS